MVLIKIAICFSYFIIGGLATTNILRLLRGSQTNVFSSECRCAVCNMKISPLNQTPIISYLVNKGKCKKCKTKLPLHALILEILVFIGMVIISAIGHFSPVSVLLSFCYYELIRIIYIIKFGRREQRFFSQYVFAILGMIPYCILIEFMGCLLLTNDLP